MVWKKVVLCILLVSEASYSAGLGMTTEVQDAIEEPKAVKMYKGDQAPYDGVLLPFNTVRSFVEYRHNYERLKEDYYKYGVVKDEPSVLETVSRYGAFIFAASLITSTLITAENKTGFIVVSAVGLSASVILLTF